LAQPSPNIRVKTQKGEIMKFYLAVLSLTLATTVLAAELPVDVPAEPNTQFFILEKGDAGPERIIVVKHVGPSGTSYSKRLYNCINNTDKYLGGGHSLVQMDESRPEINMRPIIEGSIAYYLAIEACK
jgi:hypothetical protein